jgi:two-component system, NarL family, response regulator LiaR
MQLDSAIMDAGRKVNVMIVDDHDMVRHGLMIMLQAFDDFEVVGATGDARMALTLCALYQPDVILMDLLMPYIDGVTVTRSIHDKFPTMAVVALTSSNDEALVQEALNAGAVSYLIKTGSIDEVADAVRNAYHGKPTLSPEAIRTLISTMQHPQALGDDLTKREREVLTLMAEGLTNRTIAQRLFISLSTVKNHIVNIYSKLGTSSRTKVIALTIQHHLFAKN